MNTKKIIALIVVIALVGITLSYVYFNSTDLFEECKYLDDGTKICGDIELIDIINYTIYTTVETDYTYENLGEGFIQNDDSTNYYVKVNFLINSYDSIDEKKFIVNFLDNENNYLDSSWLRLDSLGKYPVTSNRSVVFTISKDSLGNNFDKVERISFRVSQTLKSENNRCSYGTTSKYLDDRLFGTWINESIEVNDTCPDLFREYTFYSNGTGLCSHGKFYWDTRVDHQHSEYIYVDMYSYNFDNLTNDYGQMEYEAWLSFEFDNNNEIVTFDNGLYRSGFDYCYPMNHSLDYTKQST